MVDKSVNEYLFGDVSPSSTSGIPSYLFDDPATDPNVSDSIPGYLFNNTEDSSGAGDTIAQTLFDIDPGLSPTESCKSVPQYLFEQGGGNKCAREVPDDKNIPRYLFDADLSTPVTEWGTLIR